jgi:hypothetical protein
MTPAEAGAVLLEEPDWQERLAEIMGDRLDDKKYPYELVQEDAFEQLLREYRRFHFTWGDDGKRYPMPADKACIALAGLRIFPPRSIIKDVSRDGQCYEPDLGDNHMWLTINQRAWRIVAVESGTLFLDSFGEAMQIEANHPGWAKYIDKVLEALWAAHVSRSTAIVDD